MIIEELMRQVNELEKVSGFSIEHITNLFVQGCILQHPGYISMNNVDKKLMPLTLEELTKLVWDDDNTYIGQQIWVKELKFGIVLACVLDAYTDDGIVAVYGASDKEEWFFEKDYGKTWVAYLERPVGDIND